MKIGITERGDAGIDFTWTQKLDSVDGAIIISKKLSPQLIDALLAAQKPVVFHCSCTGWGGSWLEPNNPDYVTQLENLRELVNKGFPADNIVLRIDPIFPSPEGMARVCNVLNYVTVHNVPVKRFRISVYDEYKHAKERIIASGHDAFYNGSFYANHDMMQFVIFTLTKYPFVFETCAEDMLSQNSNSFIQTGCVSAKDIELMGLTLPDDISENLQNRNGCHCLGVKTELLENRKRCPNGCLYCYWKD